MVRGKKNVIKGGRVEVSSEGTIEWDFFPGNEQNSKTRSQVARKIRVVFAGEGSSIPQGGCSAIAP